MKRIVRLNFLRPKRGFRCIYNHFSWDWSRDFQNSRFYKKLLSNRYAAWFKARANFILQTMNLDTLYLCICVPKVPMHDFAKWCICILGFGLPLSSNINGNTYNTEYFYVIQHCQMQTKSRKMIQFIFVSCVSRMV